MVTIFLLTYVTREDNRLLGRGYAEKSAVKDKDYKKNAKQSTGGV